MTKKAAPRQFAPALGLPIARPNRNVGTADAPPPVVTSHTGTGERATEIYTLFTQVGPQGSRGTPLLYNGERQWARVTVTLETAGPVVVGTRSDLFPVLSGKGILLTTNQPVTFNVGKGYSRLYYGATAVSRVKVVIEPYPWLEQITSNAELIQQFLAALSKR